MEAIIRQIGVELNLRNDEVEMSKTTNNKRKDRKCLQINFPVDDLSIEEVSIRRF